MRKRAGWIAIYIIIVLLLAVIIYGIPSISGFIKGNYTAKPGEIKKNIDLNGYLIRKETIYTVKDTYSIERVAKEGALVSSGDEIVKLSESGRAVAGTQYGDLLRDAGESVQTTDNGKAVDAGFVMYKADGLENIFSPSGLPKMSEKYLSDNAKIKTTKFPKSLARKNTPIFKISENGPWGIIFFVSNKDKDDFYVGQDFDIEFKETKNIIRGKVVAKEEKKEKTRVVVQSQDHFKELLEMREAKIKIPVSRGRGLIIRNSSIVKKNGKTGVIVKNKVGKNVFKPISIIADDGIKSAVYDDIYVDERGQFVETLTIYDRILRRPNKKEIKEASELPNNID